MADDGRVGRTDPEAILNDALKVVDLEVRRMAKVTGKGMDLSPGEARALADYVRVMKQITEYQRKVGAEDLGKLSDAELDQLALQIAARRGR